MKVRVQIAVLLLSLVATVASAQATRTWVSGVGDDAFPCSRTAPCKTFAGAISKTAANGEINVIDSGAFGALTITKSLTIDAAGYLAGVLATNGSNGIIVNAGVNDVVTLRNLDINGAGTGANGIRFLAGKALYVENTSIYNFASKGISFEPSGNSTLTVRDTGIRNNANAANGGGIWVRPGALGSAEVFLERVNLGGNHFGIRAEDRSTVTIHNSSVTGSTSNGFLAFSNGGPINFSVESSVASGNGSSGVRSVGAGSLLRISNLMITNNSTGISTDTGGSVVSFDNNCIIGNDINGAPTQTLQPE